MLSAHGEQGRPGKPSRRVRDWHAPGMPGHAPIRSDNLVDNLGASEDHREEATISRGTNLLSRDEFRHLYPGRERPMTSARHPYGTNSEAEPIPRGENRSRVTGPIQFVLRLMEFWCLETADIVGLLGFDPADLDYVAAVLAGQEQFRGRDVRDRIAHLIWIRMTLWSLFQDLGTENSWLREPHALLDDASPLSLMLSGSMEDLLMTREYVDSVAGR